MAVQAGAVGGGQRRHITRLLRLGLFRGALRRAGLPDCCQEPLRRPACKAIQEETAFRRLDGVVVKDVIFDNFT